jgi:lysine-N-methylase
MLTSVLWSASCSHEQRALLCGRGAPLSQFTIVVPEYAERFRCIGPDCEDDCCHGWVVPIDPSTLAKYRALPSGPLRSQLDESIRIRQPGDGQPAFSGAASMRMLPSGECPFLTEQRLCLIHQEKGAEYLSETCARYPRFVHRIDGIEETALALSCPEAARRVLLDPDLRTSPVRRLAVQWNSSVQCDHPLRTFYWPIREFVAGLILERSYALWQRLFLLGIFCQRLDAIAHRQDKRTFPQFLSDFSAVIASGSLREPMERIPANPGLQLQLVLQLVQLGVAGAAGHPRLAACLAAFNTGIGYAEGGAFESQIAAYSAACTETFEPFFREHPWILENYLFNEFRGWAFPFGESILQPDGASDFTASFAQLAVRFGILKGLLIGVAGAHGAAFSCDHVIQTVQVATRHFEHSRAFLESSYEFLRTNKRADIAGLTALLRN